MVWILSEGNPRARHGVSLARCLSRAKRQRSQRQIDFRHSQRQEFLAAERSNRRIAVEIKSFLGKSLLDDLEKALGQFILYRTVLEKIEREREMLLAIPYDVAVVFDEPLGRLLLESNLVGGFSFDPVKEVIVQWIP
jgi:hypothetical protein